MHRAVSALGIGTAAIVAAVLLFGWLAAPAARPTAAAAAATSTVVAGAFHVHTQRSDGTGTTDQVAASARKAGLQFVIFADHGDGTRPLEPPAYRAGVLCIDGVEISTADGHYIAVGGRPAPYPLAGYGRDVVEDVERLGGFGIVAHPGSTKRELEWRAWSAPFDAMEWLNADTEWRDESVSGLFRSVLTYPFRPVETLASLLDRQEETFGRWDAVTQHRRVVAVAGADAHARISLADEGGDPRAAWIESPSYEQLFRTFSIRALLERELTGDADQDAALLLEALREGRVYTVIDGLSPAAPVHFRAASGGREESMGGILALAGSVTLSIETTLPSPGEIVLLRDGRVVATSRSPLRYDAPQDPGVYRAEVRLATAPGEPPVPWIVTNPIYVGMAFEARTEFEPPGVTTGVRLISDEEHAPGWHVESGPDSQGTLVSISGTDGRVLEFRFALGVERDLFAAVAREDFGGLAGYDGVTVKARADRPLRLSVQVRLPYAGNQLRWQRSVYLDRESRTVTIPFAGMLPVGRATAVPPLETASTLLFVVDSTNMRPGTQAAIWLEDVRLGRAGGS